MIGLRRTNPERGKALQVVLAIIGGLIVFCLLAVMVGLWAVRRYVQVEVTRSGDTKKVAISTPIGDLEVRKAQDIAEELKLPIYPGAESEDESAAVRLRGRLWKDEGGLSLTVAQFRSHDPFDQVDVWYREQLGSEFKREQGEIKGGKDGDDWDMKVEPGGDDVLYSQHREGRVRGVALTQAGGHVKMILFQASEARRQ